MDIPVKLLGSLRHYLPDNSTFNGCRLSLPDAAPVQTLIDRFKMAPDENFLVIVNDEIIDAADYERVNIQSDDEVTIFPPMKGG